jgi:hypothetical protein
MEFGLLRYFETVLDETPASFATSFICANNAHLPKCLSTADDAFTILFGKTENVNRAFCRQKKYGQNTFNNFNQSKTSVIITTRRLCIYGFNLKIDAKN